jgi:NAD(P)-dependent dehydrogenase (short-subunit alcohol dehydrogenase family)
MDAAIGYHRSGRAARRVAADRAARFECTLFATTSLAQYDRLLDLNLRGAFFCSQAAARVLRHLPALHHRADPGSGRR